MHDAVIAYNKLPVYRIVYLCSGVPKSFEGTLQSIYIQSMMDFSGDYGTLRMSLPALLKGDIVVATTYHSILQYLDDEVHLQIKGFANGI